MKQDTIQSLCNMKIRPSPSIFQHHSICPNTIKELYCNATKTVVPKLWYAYHWWYAKAFKVVSK